MIYHEPVLLKESIEGLNINPLGIYVDVTFGGGGHSGEILKKLKKGKLFAFDQDEETIKSTINDERFVLISKNFKYIKNTLKMYNVIQVEGVLADLGISSHQIDSPDRGFSQRFNSGLDMRMDKNTGLTAKKIINTYTEKKLKEMFSSYGEVRNASKLSSLIVKARKDTKINTVDKFKKVINPCVRYDKQNKYFARVFQALRIEVNDELNALEDFLSQCKDIIKTGGRLAVISYHSLEDRRVKNFIKSGNVNGVVEKDFYGKPIVSFKAINKKPVYPTKEEIAVNSRARSAKLRVAKKL
ncbi:MAG: 16S rRNA (cytosine(1402)-N(4))-methyltransferase RsmH [Bacteroidota bacterium]